MHQSDVTVIGGSLCGCMAAIEAARAGAGVVLIETGTFLGNEFTQSLRPWIKSSGYENMDKDLKRALFSCDINSSSYESSDIEIALYMGEIKKNLLKMLLENGVIVLYMSEVVGIITEDDGVDGVLIGTKNGLKVLRTKSVIDATENKRAAWFAGANRKVYQKDITVRRTIEYFKVNEPTEMCMKVPKNLGIHDDTIELHRGKHQKDQYFVDFALRFKASDGSYKERMAMEIEAREKTQLLAQYLKQHTVAFENAFLQQSSYQLYSSQLFHIEGLVKEEGDIVEIEACRNIFTFGVNVKLGANPDCDEVMSYINIAQKVGKKAAQSVFKCENSHKFHNSILCLGSQKLEFNSSQLIEDVDENLGVDLYSADLSLVGNIPMIGNYDIVVSGGGTAGIPAAIASASMGAKVGLIEDFWGLGGTKTLGGVARYYHGYRGGYTSTLDKSVLEMSEKVTNKADVAHIESKMMTMFSEIDRKGISLFMGTKTVGAVMKDNCIKGVVIANSEGLGIIGCNVVVDATGDGDVAAFAGAAFSYGSIRDGSVQTFNHNGYVKGSFTDLGVIDSKRISDVMRGLYIAHEKNNDYDFRPLLTVRESRRIEGDYQINMSDILFKSNFEDAISITMSDCDPHGINASLISRLGYLPLRSGEKCANIPYRACLPKGIEGLLITAKAISATKDASNFLRVSADIQNQGYAVGIAAALANKHGVMPRYIDISELQGILLKEDIIQENALKAKPDAPIEEKSLVNAVAEGDEEAFLQVICRKKKVVLELLEKKYTESSEKLLLAKALAWFGSNTGVGDLVDELDKLWTKEDGKFFMDLNPIYADGTVMSGFLNEPNVYWKINQIIILLGMAGDKAALEQISSIAYETESGGPHYIVPQAYMYGKVRIDWVRVPHYDRIMSLAFCMERLADHKAIPALERLIDRPYIGGYACKEDIYAGGNYLSAYLEICVARALARCGSTRGALLLTDYLDDVQAILSDHAYHELKEISGQDFGKDSVKWKEWIQAQEVLLVKPYTEVFYEPMQ